MESTGAEDISGGAVRLVEMHARILPRLLPVFALSALLVLVAAPFYGWILPLLFLVNSIKSGISWEFGPRRFGHELTHMADEYTSMAAMGGTIYFSGGAGSPFLPLIASFAALSPMIFNQRHVIRSFIYLIAVMAIASLGPPKFNEYEALFRVGNMVVLMLTLRVLSTELMGSDLRYRAASLVDKLTGLANRRAFDIEFAAVRQQVLEVRKSTALVVGDIDHFKRINDEHGHSVGDVVLQVIAKELQDSFRHDDVAYRIGGEEFAFILVGVDAQRAEGMASSLRDRVAISYPADLEVSMSFGVAMLKPDEDNKAWFSRADAALYAAKNAGRNRVEIDVGNT